MITLLLAACTDPDTTKPSHGRDTSADTSADADTDADTDADSDADTDTSGTSDVETILADLRHDLDGTMLAESRATGWPVPTSEGYLFVCTDPGAWKLAGDHDGWAGADMTQESGFSWIVVPISAAGGYKFTNGTDWNADPWSRSYTYDDFGEMSLVMPEGAHLERHFRVGSDTLAERTIRVWVPAESPTHVLYTHDGQNLFDPSAFWGGWHLQDSAPEAMLIVGIDNTDARMDEYTHDQDVIDGTAYGGRGAEYAAFVEDDVRPLIASVYGEPPVVGTMGSSLGGLISFYIADQYPGEYDYAASLSGTMGWGSIGADNATMIDIYAAAGHRDTALYLDSGGDGTCWDNDGDGIQDDDPDATDNYCENAQLRDVLAAEGYTYDVDLWHWHEPGAEHNEEAWAARVWRPLQIFAGL